MQEHSAMTNPVQQPRPPLEDPLNERELFANEVVDVGTIHGNVTITLANTRFEEPVGANPPKARRVVAARIVLTGIAANQLLANLQRLSAQIEAIAAAAAGHKPH
jgi:hypothetical protein